MTAPTPTTAEPLADFRAHLTPHVNRQLRSTARAAVLVHRAVHTNGWTAAALAAECMRDHDPKIRNPAALVMHRLEWCADNPPPDRHTPKTLPFCTPECAERRGFIEDDTGRPIGKCQCRTPQEAHA